MIALVALLLCGGALEEDPGFLEGRRLYDELAFDEAAKAFERASLVVDRSDQERAELRVWMGLSYAQLGDFRLARAAFVRALEISPEVGLPSGVSPKIHDVFEAARRRARPPAAEPPPRSPPAPEPDVEPSVAEAPVVVDASPERSPKTSSTPPRGEAVSAEDGPVTAPAQESRGNGDEGRALPSWPFFAGAGVAAAAGGAMLVGAFGVGAVSYAVNLGAQDPSLRQREALGQVQFANMLLGGAAAGGIAGVVVLGGAAAVGGLGATIGE